MSCVYVDRILPTASQHKRMTYTNCCIYTVVTPDHEQQACSKYLEVNYWNKLKINSVSCWFLLYGFVVFFTLSSLLIYTLHSFIQNSDNLPCIGLLHNIPNGLKHDEDVTGNSVVSIWFNFLLLVLDNYIFRHPSLIAVTAVILINVTFLSLCVVRLPTNILVYSA